MKKSPIDYLLLASRMFLVLAFLGHLVVAGVGYSILPNQVVTYANPDYPVSDKVRWHDGQEFELRNPWSYSKEYFLGLSLALAFVCFTCGFFIRFKEEPDQSSEYWDREENYLLKGKIDEFLRIVFFTIMLSYLTVLLIRLFSVNLSTPRSGVVYSPFELFLILLVSYVFGCLTFAIVKRRRVRNALPKM